ncbi:MAG: nucleotidyltransferase domain-containing protein, partial [Candidatus Binatia bacterium]
ICAGGHWQQWSLPRSRDRLFSIIAVEGTHMTRRLKLKSKDAALEEFLRSLRSTLGKNLLEAKLFGSRATGRDQPDSDIDLLVVVNRKGAETEDRVLDIAFDVNLKHDVYISPRVIDRSTLSDPVWSITPFLRASAKEGIPL